MSLVLGTRIGAFEITGTLGAGGMGDVYRARDTKLEREVAIKVLPESFAHDPERVARFSREARTLAALNHPNIGGIHGLEDAHGLSALVLELIEGPTLADRIAHGPIPIEEALPIARQLADALEAAHEQGIIHRDLKPANIKVRDDGVVKVLDFGLAKALAGVAQGVSPADDRSPDHLRQGVGAQEGLRHMATASPTITTPAMTQAGMILGTAAYMSPEQAKGREADKRSDIWAFGAVLYEMLTGRRAFDGEDVVDVLGAVARLEPDWAAVPPEVPQSIRTLLHSCLVKDRRQRVADISVARFVLDKSATLSAPPGDGLAALAPARSTARWRRTLPVAAAVVLTAAIVGTGMWVSRPSPAPLPVSRFSVPLLAGERLSNAYAPLAISPDGVSVVYSANNRLNLRSIEKGNARVIPGTEGGAGPVFSPDGQSIAFFDRGSRMLKRISVTGGAAATIGQVDTPIGMSWGADGIVLGQGIAGIVRISPNGGTPEPLVKMEAGESAHGPQVLPGGDAILFTLAEATGAGRWDRARVVVHSLRSGTRRTVIERGRDARYLPTGHVVYAVEGTLFAVPFDAGSQTVTGGPVPVVVGVRLGGVTTAAALFAVSDTGTLVYIAGPATTGPGPRVLLLTDRRGASTPLSLPPGPYVTPRASRDGLRIAFGRDDDKETEVWIHELAGTSAPRRLTFGGRNRFPVWSADSTRIAFQSDREGDLGIFLQTADGGAAERLTRAGTGEAHTPESWSPDGARLLYAVSKASTFDLWAITIADKKAALVATLRSAGLPGAVFSPDGRWVAYTFFEQSSRASSQVANNGVYLMPFPATGEKFQVPKRAIDYHPAWAPDGRALFYVPSSSRPTVAVTVRTQPGVTFGNPVELQVPQSRQVVYEVRDFDVLPDGRFITAIPVSELNAPPTPELSEIQVVLNWTEELKRLVPRK